MQVLLGIVMMLVFIWLLFHLIPLIGWFILAIFKLGGIIFIGMLIVIIFAGLISLGGGGKGGPKAA